MRCRFYSQPELASEAQARSEFDAACQRFFSALVSCSDAQELHELLHQVDDNLELLRIREDADGLLVDLRGDPPRRPCLERLRRAAPEGVQVVAERGPLPFDAACRDLEALTGAPVKQARVRAGITRGHLLDLLVYLPRGATNGFATEGVAEMAVEACLGERTVDDWVHTISAEPLLGAGPLKLVQMPEAQAQSFPLAELRTAVEKAVAGVYNQLPSLPLCQLGAQGDWLMLEAEPGTYGQAVRQADLVMASTCLPEMLKCFLTDAPFASLRFSKHNERFVYLKYQDQGSAEARVRARQKLEDSVDQALRKEHLGCVVGNGFGSGHSYIDIALLDLDAGLSALGRVARGAELPTASWILFCDSEWWLEWVGVWPETPEPLTQG